MAIVIYIVSAVFVLLAAALLFSWWRGRHAGALLLAATYLIAAALALLLQTTLGIDDLLQMELEAARQSFLEPAIKSQALRQLLDWAALAGLALPLRPPPLPSLTP